MSMHLVFISRKLENKVYADGFRTNHWFIPVVPGDPEPLFSITAFNTENTHVVCKLSKFTWEQTFFNREHHIQYSLKNPFSSGVTEFKLQATFRCNDGYWRFVDLTLPEFTEYDEVDTDYSLSDDERTNN